jgi:DNA transposition AAA+ family ATPase
MSLDLAYKKRVSENLVKYLEESPENRTVNGLADEHGITKLYVSRIKNGIFEIKHQEEGKAPTIIADEYFHRIAEAIGMAFRSGTGLHWETFNFKQVQSVCARAQGKRLRVLLEGDTGFGKTYGLEFYTTRKDKVIYIKVTRSMTERNMLQAILKRLNIREDIRGTRTMLNAIRYALTGTPGYLLIIDETEYLKPNLWHVVKEIADFTENKCGLIVSGLGITQIIHKLADRKRMGFRQLRRRFFPNRVLLPTIIETSEKVRICEEAGITERTAINVIREYCNDFDMLSTVIKDAVQYQKSKGDKITGDMIMKRFKDTFEI